MNLMKHGLESIPKLPNVYSDEQRKNAETLERDGAQLCIIQKKKKKNTEPSSSLGAKGHTILMPTS